MQEINVDKIMEEIREEIRKKGMESNGPEFADVTGTMDLLEIPEEYDKDIMHTELVSLNELWDTSPEELHSKHLVNGAVKRMIQRAVHMVINSHIAKQVAFNISVVDCLNMLSCLEKENESMRKEIEVLKKEVQQIKEKE